MADMHEGKAPEQASGANMAAVQYYISCIADDAEVGLGFLRQELLGDAGIGSGKRFEDPEQESWKGDSKKSNTDKKFGKKEDPLDSLVPPEMAAFEKEIQKSEFHQQAGKVEQGSKIRFGTVEKFLEFLDKQHRSEGAFVLESFKLAEFEGVVPETMRIEVATAFARLAIKASKEARQGLSRALDLEAAVQIIAQKILAS